MTPCADAEQNAKRMTVCADIKGTIRLRPSLAQEK